MFGLGFQLETDKESSEDDDTHSSDKESSEDDDTHSSDKESAQDDGKGDTHSSGNGDTDRDSSGDDSMTGVVYGPLNAKVTVKMEQPTTSEMNRTSNVGFYLTPKPNLKQKYKNKHFIAHSHHMGVCTHTFGDDEKIEVIRMYPTTQEELNGDCQQWSFDAGLDSPPVATLPIDLLDDLIGCPILFGWEYKPKKFYWFKLFDGC